jgi:hypothetical protein
VQFVQFLHQFAKDTQEYLQSSTQPEKQTLLQGQLDAITLIMQKFQQLFTLPDESPRLFDERKERYDQDFDESEGD